jgi:hypothetical protein
MKLQEQQSKKWVADEEVDNCTKCNVAFGWTVRRVCSFNLGFSYHIDPIFSIIVEIVKRFSVIIVRVIGYKVQKQSRSKKNQNKILFLFISVLHNIVFVIFVMTTYSKVRVHLRVWHVARY